VKCSDEFKITTVNCTVVDPKYFDERSFATVRTARIYANEGLCQILFFESDEVCETSDTDRKGKYQAQKGIVLPKL
jgi:deoxycytidine triphosphate deaminase